MREESSVKKRFKTKKGHIKKNLDLKDWNEISQMREETTLMNYLYRKRIKSNYQDIDVFTFRDIKSESIHKGLLIIVEELNLINEVLICKSLGKDKYFNLVTAFSKLNGNNIFLDRRKNIIENILY